MRTLLTILGLLANSLLSAQDTCACVQILDRFIGKVEHNYAGFTDKVNDATRPAYNALVDSLHDHATAITDKSVCFNTLDAYRAFFRDKHLQLSGSFAPSPDGRTGAPPRMTTWTVDGLKTHFNVHRESLRTLEGIWRMDPYEVGLVYNDHSARYDAVIMKSGNAGWKEGMVKFTATQPTDERSEVTYWRGDHSMTETSATYAPGHLAMKSVGTWHMVAPPAGALDERTFELEYSEEVRWKLLDDSTLYIKLGSCDLANKAVLDSLVSANKRSLEHIPNWIVDFRDNGGGSTDVFQSLLPYLYTKPFKEYGVSHWLSPDNTLVLKEFLVANEKMMDPASARSVRALVTKGEKHPDTWHHGRGSTSRFKQHDMPRRVAILANKHTASSGESFLEMARGMSDKCVIFGENTGGFMDYGDVMPRDLGCDGLGAAIPTSRMNRIDHGLAYDQEGIAPDVRIEGEKVNWIDFVRNYWGQHEATPR